jgi:uncharacterized protein (DUF169 family)
MMGRWKEVAAQFEHYLRLRTFPVALKLYESAGEMEKVEKIKKPTWKATLCQLVTVARTYGWTIGATEEEFLSPYCPSTVGFCSPPKAAKDGRQFHEIWFATQEDARTHQRSMRRIPEGRFKAIALAPLFQERIDPDMVILYGTPAQMIRLIAGIQWEEYERLQFYSVGESACTDFIGECYHSGKPSLTIPCFGERRYGGVQEDELVIAIPPNAIDKILKGLAATQKSGIRYPIPFYGCQADPMPGMPPKYLELMKEEKGH